jgi:hypothetical protein
MNSFFQPPARAFRAGKGHFTTAPLLASNGESQSKVTVDDPAAGGSGTQILGI